MKKVLFPVLACLVLAVHSMAQTWTVESVPNPKTANNTLVSNPDNVLSGATVTDLNSMLRSLEDSTTDQVAVVVLNSIGQEVPKDFAYRLFNYWGIGVKGKNNGLLVLMVMDQRRVEFETGYGMEAMLPDALCKRIQEEYMVPRFKENNYDAGILDGMRVTVDVLQNPQNSEILKDMEAAEGGGAYLTEDGKNILTGFLVTIFSITLLIVFFVKRNNKSFADGYENATKQQKEKVTLVISKTRWLILYAIIPLIFLFAYNSFYGGENYFRDLMLSLYIYFLLIFIEKRIRSNSSYKATRKDGDFYDNYQKYTGAHKGWWAVALFFPLPFIFYFILYLIEKSRLRNHPRNCRECNSMLTKLDEKSDDQHLSKSQLMEENLDSVDYDVWYCSSCQHKDVLSYKRIFSRYSECSKCSTRAYYLVSDRTLISATYDSSGTGERSYSCKYCGYAHTQQYTIPRKTRSSSSSGGGGGSFGGGSSGGGGSGSSW